MQNDLLTSVSGNVTAIKALNLQITQFAADILQVAKDYTTKMSTDAALQCRRALVGQLDMVPRSACRRAHCRKSD